MKTESVLSIERFVRVLELAGVDAAARKRLHRVFEREDPAGHDAFLSALNAAPDAVTQIRAESARSGE